MAAATAAQRRNYELLYEWCLVRPNRRAAVDQLVAAITKTRTR